jgi:hypothetical protein
MGGSSAAPADVGIPVRDGRDAPPGTPPPGTPPPSSTAAQATRGGGSPSATAPLLLWLGLQFLALLLALLRVPLAAGYPATGEMLAAQVLVVTQVTASALLFPWVLRDRWAAVAVIATAWPFVVLAGVVSAAPAGRVAAAGCYVSAWLGALWAWRAAGRGTGQFAGQFAGVAVASMLTAGALVLFYLRLEFAAAPADEAERVAWRWAAASPPLAALKQLGAGSGLLDWCVPAAVMAAACARGVFSLRSRQLIHKL